MAIVGLTDNVIPRFPRLGKLRKGGEKPTAGNKPGKELSHFRFTSDNPAIVKAFHDAYGNEPVSLRVYLPYPSTEMNFSTWKEAWAAGGLVHRCDGKTCTIWRTPDGKYSQQPKPCPGGCKEVGRLEVILPELITAGFVGYVTLETHSLHDLINITATLEAVRQSAQDRPNGLQGIEFVLRRKNERISTPDGKGGRVSREKWLVSIEPVPSWAQTYLALASGSVLAIEAPQAFDTDTGEIFDDDDDDTIEGEYTETQPDQTTNGANGATTATTADLPFRPTVEGAIEWACTTAPQVWPTNGDGTIVTKAVEASFRKLQKTLTGRPLMDAWVAKVNDKLATFKASQASETTEDSDEPLFS